MCDDRRQIFTHNKSVLIIRVEIHFTAKQERFDTVFLIWYYDNFNKISLDNDITIDIHTFGTCYSIYFDTNIVTL